MVEYTAKVLKPRSFPSKTFLPGRMAMTCCADDIRYYGYPCKIMEKTDIPLKKWVRIRARLIRYTSASGNEQPVLYLIQIRLTEKPKEDVVALV